MSAARESCTTYIGIGSNLENPRFQVEQALLALSQTPGCKLCRQSSLYRSAPLGPTDQPHYINAVAELATCLAPLELLQQLQILELRQGRVRTRRWGPRTLDLDLLLYGDVRMNHPHLTIPHPGIPDRNFVLHPLAEIAPALQLPGGEGIAELLANCPAAGIVRLSSGDPLGNIG